MEWKLSSTVGTSSLCKAALNLTDAVQEQVLKVQDRSAGHASEPNVDIDLREVYFLIMHFLSAGPCQKTFSHLKDELLEHELLPRRYHAWFSRSAMDTGKADDDGISFPLGYNKLVERYPHVETDHLVKLLQQLLLHISSPLHGKVEGNVPNAADVPTLLGSGPFSLLDRDRSVEDQQVRPVASYLRWPHMHADQVRGLSLREIGGGFTKHHRAPSIRSACYAIAKPSTMVQKMQNIKKLRGHSNAVYCAIFDRSGRYVITGSDDRLVKIWSMETAFCLASCRGHEGDITDLAVSSNNVLVASASNDFVIRVWHLPDGRPMSVLQGHTGAVTAIAFSPRPNSVYQLLSSSDDGTCRIWDARYSHCSPRIYVPSPSDAVTGKSSIPSNNVASTSNTSQSHQILCCAYNANGTVFVTGSSDSNARVWSALISNTDDLDQRVHELDVLRGHENDVNYVQFSGCAVTPRSSMFDPLKEDSIPKFKNSWFCHDNIVTCSRDGSAIIWTPRSRKSHGKSGRWTKAYHLKVPPPPMPPRPPRGGPRQRFLPTPRGVNMIVWSLDNRFVLAAIMDCRICVWNAADGSLVHCLTGHAESSYVLDVHPFNPRIAMSAGYDGRTIIWDIWEGAPIRIYEIGRFRLVDGKFSQDGTSIVLSDEVGQIYLLNTGQGESQKDAKYDQFFLGDYRPLIRDTVGNVLDQETQLVPYRRNLQDLLCDSSMIPYPEPYQSIYQKRRLGALGLEWCPSSIKFATGPDYSLGQDNIMPPLEDLDRMIEPLPEFIDPIYWEPENEVISDDTDSEYNAEEISVDGARASLCSSSSSDLESSSDDSDVEQIHKDNHYQPRRRKHVRVESATSSGRHVKKRTLDEHDGSVSVTKRSKNSRRGRKAFNKKSSDATTLRPQRIAARNARSMLSKISGSSTDMADEDDSDDSLDSESMPQNLRIQDSETDRSLQTLQPRAKPSGVLESLGNDKQRKKLILKIPAKKPVASVDVKQDVMNQIDLGQSSSKAAEEDNKESIVGTSSGEPGSSSADAIGILSQSCDRVDSMDMMQTVKVEYHLEESAGDKQNAVRWDEEMPVAASSEFIVSRNVIVESQTDLNRDGDQTRKAALSIDGLDRISNKTKESAPKKLLKLRLKLNPPRSPSKLQPVETAEGKGDFISEGPSSMYQAIGSRMQRSDESCGSGTITRENMPNFDDSCVPEVDFTEPANDAICRTRSMKNRATSREENDQNSCFPERFGHASTMTLRKQENSSMGVYDQTLSEDFPSSSRVGTRLRSTRNRQNSYHTNEQSSLTGKNPNNAPRKLSWLTLSEHEEGFRYIPQLGDEVVYLRQGHQEYLQSRSLNDMGPWSSFPGRLNAVEFCKVDKLEYGTSPGSGESCCRVTLRFLDPSSGVFGKSFNLTLPDLIDFPDFVIEKTRYDAAVKRNWGIRDKCRVWWKDESGEGGHWWEGRIVCSRAKSNEFPDSPWERYSVQYKKSPDNLLHSPWELYDPNFPWERSTIDDEIIDKLLTGFAKLEKAISRHQDTYGIQKLNEAAQKLDFCNRFPVPLYPELIQLRLENRYYRTVEAFKHDMEVMLSNAESYFSRNTMVISKTRRLSDWFERMLDKVLED